MLVKTFASAIYGVNALTLTVEVSTAQGLPSWAIVGLPDNAVRESRERVEAAIRHLGYEFPRGRVTINMAPADVRKEGADYDLTLAIGLLAASGQVKPDRLEHLLVMGELSLDGTLRPITGALPIAIEGRKQGFKGFLLPLANAQEAGIVNQLDVLPVSTLREAVQFLNGALDIAPANVDTRELFADDTSTFDNDFADVRGQEAVKRALEVAAAGGHNVIMIGPPGAGKTMLAKRMGSILPPLSLQEALETTKIYSVAGKLATDRQGLVAQRPFRAPHHTISDVALVGGGVHPKPGEISLAHNGVLFLDELPEFKRTVLEVMRQPLEERVVTIARSKFTVEYPTNFMLIASMNPCPCGYYNHPERACTCAPGLVQRYLGKVSGPLLDRIDLHVEITPVPFDELSGKRAPETSHDIRLRVIEARKRQHQRFTAHPGIHCNALMPSPLVRELCVLDKPGENLLKVAMQKLSLSARAFDRILRVARTIADLGDSPDIHPEHVAEAIQYRSLDRETWGA
jgi:magnesium chelatase family protein